MSGICCACGEYINDWGNFQGNKGYYISNANWDAYFEILDVASNPPAQYRSDREEISGAASQLLGELFRQLYQCTHCGRLHVFGPRGGYFTFKPEFELQPNSVLAEESTAEGSKTGIWSKIRSYWAERDRHYAVRAEYAAALERGERPIPPPGIPISSKELGKTRDEDVDVTEDVLTQLFPNIKPPN